MALDLGLSEKSIKLALNDVKVRDRVLIYAEMIRVAQRISGGGILLLFQRKKLRQDQQPKHAS